MGNKNTYRFENITTGEAKDAELLGDLLVNKATAQKANQKYKIISFLFGNKDNATVIDTNIDKSELS